LAGCGAKIGPANPTDTQLRQALNLLINQYETNYKKLINWNDQALTQQLMAPLPKGYSGEAGWVITWPNPKPGQLPSVILPWSLLQIYPTDIKYSNTLYKDNGNKIDGPTYNQIQSIEDNLHPLFSGTVNGLESKVDGKWIIFTEVPYLPVTDEAYGFAHYENGGWKIADFGSARVGCGVVPNAVEAEFGFTC
jgi:hypothetical protein